MATVKLYLDTRHKAEEYPLKICINKKSSSAYISLNIKLKKNQWDSVKEKIKEHPNRKTLQSYVENQLNKVSNLVYKLTQDGKLTGFSATQIKNTVQTILEPRPQSDSNLFYSRFLKYTSLRAAQRTKDIYLVTSKKIKEFDKKIELKSFEEITKDWLNEFDAFLTQQGSSVNNRSIHFRNIRAVFNDALDNEITSFYPFRVFKIKTESTIKKALTIDELKTLFSFSSDKEFEKTIDLFKLCIYLVGINISDLYNLKEINSEGRVIYKRNKTGKLYSIKVESEAKEIIEKYKGKYFLLNLHEMYSSVHTFTIAFSRSLQRIGKTELVEVENYKHHGKTYKKVYHPILPHLTSYFARHTWATLASELNISEDIISHSLGHSFSSGASVTQIYINFNLKKIDEANRKVIDYIISNT